MNNLTSIANPWIDGLRTYEPGKPLEEVARELGFANAAEMVKLASNENALGPSPRALEAIRASAAQMHRYPDGGAFYLKQGLCGKLGIDASQLLVTNGSNEAIELLGHVFLNGDASIVMADKAFLVYRLVASIFKASAIVVPMQGLTHDLDAMAKAVTPATRLVFIANPNNPTGTMVDEAALDTFMDALPDTCVAVLDEAYIELLPPDRQPNTLKYVREGRPVYLLRTFSKAYGLAGLRIGYAVSTPEGIELLQKVRQPFNANAMAQAAALAALEDEAHIEATRTMVRDGLRQLEEGLDAMGIAHVPSVTNFLLVQVGEGRKMFEAMQRHKLIVRPMDVYGMPEYVRVTVGTAAQNQAFLDVLAAWMTGKVGS